MKGEARPLLHRPRGDSAPCRCTVSEEAERREEPREVRTPRHTLLLKCVLFHSYISFLPAQGDATLFMSPNTSFRLRLHTQGRRSLWDGTRLQCLGGESHSHLTLATHLPTQLPTTHRLRDSTRDKELIGLLEDPRWLKV